MRSLVLCAALGLLCPLAMVTAAEADAAEAEATAGLADDVLVNQDSIQMKAELENMITSRDVELYELSFQPVAIERVLLKDRLGHERLFHYIAFRLRNQITDDTRQEVAVATRYNEILKQMSEEYADRGASVKDAVTLDVHGEKVLDRAELNARKRTVTMTVLAYDENGSRIQVLGEPDGAGSQNTFNFPDYGDFVAADTFGQVRDAAEEQVGRRLRTLDEIAKLELPPYDPQTADADEDGLDGEVFGVIIFNRLNDHGDRFTIEVRGLSNKLRVKTPDPEKGQLENYLQTRVMRRVYVLRYDHPGDEFYRDQDPFVLAKSGWEWLNTFQRVQTRADMAYARYFLDNITDEKGERKPAVEDEFWPYYGKARETRPQAGEKLPDLEDKASKPQE